jgi:hypothetical protein
MRAPDLNDLMGFGLALDLGAPSLLRGADGGSLAAPMLVG